MGTQARGLSRELTGHNTRMKQAAEPAPEHRVVSPGSDRPHTDEGVLVGSGDERVLLEPRHIRCCAGKG